MHAKAQGLDGSPNVNRTADAIRKIRPKAKRSIISEGNRVGGPGIGWPLYHTARHAGTRTTRSIASGFAGPRGSPRGQPEGSVP